MWRAACTLLIGALAVGLIRTARRLGEAQAELERLRAAASATATGAAQPGATARERDGESEPAEVGAGGTDLATEWEQAVPPMDS
jgi:hypothetical protein